MGLAEPELRHRCGRQMVCADQWRRVPDLKRARIRIDFPLMPPSGLPAAPSPDKSAGGAKPEAGKNKRKAAAAPAETTLRAFIAAGIIKAPLQLERNYKGVQLSASLRQDG